MMDEIKLILAKLKIVSEEETEGLYLCDKKHSKILLDYIEDLQERLEKAEECRDELLEVNEKRLHPNHKLRGNWYTQKAVEQYKDGFLVKTYPSATEAGRQNGFAKNHIMDCCNGKQKSAYGYVWRYVDSGPYIPLDELVEILEDEVDRLNNLVLKMKGID